MRFASPPLPWEAKMGFLRGALAGLGAWKLGGGCISTIIIFLLLYWLLGGVLD